MKKLFYDKTKQENNDIKTHFSENNETKTHFSENNETKQDGSAPIFSKQYLLACVHDNNYYCAIDKF